MSSLALSNSNLRAPAISALRPQVLKRSKRYQSNNPSSKITSIDSFRSLGPINSESPSTKSLLRAFQRLNLDYEDQTVLISALKAEKYTFESFYVVFTHSSKWHSKVLSQLFRKAMQFKMLTNISLSLNFKSASEFENLGKVLRGQLALKTLDLSFVNADFSNKTLKSMFTEVKRSPELVQLRLGFIRCSFNKLEFENSLQSLKSCKSLKKFFLNFQHTGSNPSLVEMTEMLQTLPKVEEIGLSYKAGLNLGFEGLSDACSKLLNLKYLDLDFSSFFSINLQDLPLLEAGIEALKLLKAVKVVTSIEIEDSWVKKIIESSRYLENLQVNDQRWKISDYQIAL